jgi:hypothetical protein
MTDPNLDGEDDYEIDSSQTLAFTEVTSRLSFYDELKSQDVDDNLATEAMKSCGQTFKAWHALRKALTFHFKVSHFSDVNLAKLKEMNVEVAPPPEEGGQVRLLPYGYVTLGSAEFVHARKYVLTLMCVAVLGALNADNVAMNIAPVPNMDYAVYGTTASDFETALFTEVSYAMYSTGDLLLGHARDDIKGLRELVRKERQRERGLTQKGISTQTLVRLIPRLAASTGYPLSYAQVANSVGCGHVLASIKNQMFPIDARTTPECLKPLGDTLNGILGKPLY